RASSARTCTFGAISGDDSIAIASTPRWFAIKKAASKSEGRCTSTTSNWTFSVLAAFRTESNCTGPVSGSHSTAARESFGLHSTSISIHFAVKSGKIEEYASDVAPWSRKGSCHTAGDRVRFEIDCDNRNGARGRSSRVQYRGAA